MITLESVTFRYGTGTPIFDHFSWTAARGEVWAVLGPSGCGKSTLLHLLAGLLQPTGGRVIIDGQPLTRPRPYTGLIIQDYGLLPWATVRENAALGLRIRNFYGPDGTHAPRDYRPTLEVTPWLERLGLLEVADHFPGQISGGQRQRTAIARTLALHPDVLLMDEPFSSLDAPTRESLQGLVLDLWREQALTLVMVTHAIEEAAFVGQKILLLGQPPNREAVVLDNPGAGSPSYRESEPYQGMCRELRARLGGR
ncbi:MAG TPA: ABC transporter ATP-binding protein [Anaerolinea thermolimosa]|uniref:ABC transporter ATP-binding protein n=1 Tax=Anaerolinea thermolimosa TaxID=229919 RepID=A0A3D1JIF5_9CHLR|nr:ATP-binding cassette domain-containing protein [Anaerolinea thermolimosa]GAP05349.1 ABC-type nitrate/sulfonate/bicarbonate transport system, ATPase component [Anaerolinea thermolimosa]HCE18292.1 ABC transporter ATP-binding protein [Anaerolinea thermolimosa]